MSRGPNVELTGVELQILHLVVGGQESLEVDQVVKETEIKRAYVARALFALRRKGYLKRDGWTMRPAVPVGVIEGALIGEGYAARGC